MWMPMPWSSLFQRPLAWARSAARWWARRSLAATTRPSLLSIFCFSALILSRMATTGSGWPLSSAAAWHSGLTGHPPGSRWGRHSPRRGQPASAPGGDRGRGDHRKVVLGHQPPAPDNGAALVVEDERVKQIRDVTGPHAQPSRDLRHDETPHLNLLRLAPLAVADNGHPTTEARPPSSRPRPPPPLSPPPVSSFSP